MNNERVTIFIIGAMLAAGLALITGCERPRAHAEEDEHGHAGHGHEGHDHASAHVTNKDGVAMCGEHGVPEAECATCNPDEAAKLKPGQSLKVRLPSTNSTAIVGVEIATPEVGAISDGVDCVAEISYNQNKFAQVGAPVGGIVQSVEADLGSTVKEGQTIARIWSASIAETVAKAVLSHQTLDRERRLRKERVTSQAALDEVEATHRAACQQLRTLGFTEDQIDEFGKNPQAEVLMDVRAPFSGEIVERTAVRGALVEAGKTLFAVADLSVAWANIQVPEAALAGLTVGNAVELRVDSLPGRTFKGKLTWVGSALDEHTRMGRARAEFVNPDRLLKDKMFASVRIITRQSNRAILVPAAAVQRIGRTEFVFVQLGDDLFDARAVSLGAKREGQLEVLTGIDPKDRIAVDRTFAIKSAMLMSRLGAGCADD